jgi:hypothetical protein
MIPHKTSRGAAALERLKTFEGIPPPYDTQKRMVVPQALRVLRLKPGRKYCTVGRLGHEFGWKYQDVIARYVVIGIYNAGEHWLMAMQTGGEEKGQERRLLRAQEEDARTDRPGSKERQGGHRDQEDAGRLRLLDIVVCVWRNMGEQWMTQRR